MPQQYLGQRQDVTPQYLAAERDQDRLEMQREQLTKKLDDNEWERAFKEKQFRFQQASDAYDREFGKIKLEKRLEGEEKEREFKGEQLEQRREVQERLLTQNERLQTRLWYLDKNVSPEAKKEFAESEQGKSILEDVFSGAVPPVDRYERPIPMSAKEFETKKDILEERELAEGKGFWESIVPGTGEAGLKREGRQQVITDRIKALEDMYLGIGERTKIKEERKEYVKGEVIEKGGKKYKVTVGGVDPEIEEIK